MAWFDEYDIPDRWSVEQEEIYDDLVHGDPIIGADDNLQFLFEAIFEEDLKPWERDAVFDEISDYLWDYYEIDFDTSFDWDAYREFYDSQ